MAGGRAGGQAGGQAGRCATVLARNAYIIITNVIATKQKICKDRKKNKY